MNPPVNTAKKHDAAIAIITYIVESVAFFATYFVELLNNSNFGMGIFRFYGLDVEALSSYTIKLVPSNVSFN